MTANNVILSQPEADHSVSYTLPEGETSQLSFDKGDVTSVHVNDHGGLVITFEGGGELVISNFDSFTDGGASLYLADGTYINPAVLTSTPQAPGIFQTVNIAANDSAVVISQPAAQTTQEVALTQGQKYVCDFNPANAATVEVKDGQMVLTFVDGSQVVISNYDDAMQGDLPPEITLTDGTVVDGDALLTQVTETIDTEEVEGGEEDLAALAEQLAAVQPASGEASGSTHRGYGFNSSVTDVMLISPDAVGPLGATALRYLAPGVSGDLALELDDIPEIEFVVETLDETGLGGGPLSASGVVHVNYGNDDPGFIAVNGNTSVIGSMANNVFSSQGVPIVITQTTSGYEGYAGSTLVFTFEIDVHGNYEYNQYESFDHADPDDPNDVIGINFGITAQDADGDRSSSNVRVMVADDAPIIFSQIAESVDETDFTGGTIIQNGQFYAEIGEDDVTNGYAVNDTFTATGSLAGGALTSHGEAVTVTSNGNVYTGTANGTVIFTLTLDTATGAFVYQQFGPLDHGDPNDPNDVITLDFGVEVTDFDGDHAGGFITVHVLDDAPEIFDAYESLNEQNLTSGPIVETGSVNPNFHADGEGEVTPEGTFTATGSMTGGTLSHDGVAVVVTETANGYVGVAGTTTVFTLDINPQTGNYTFTLLENLDHADTGNPNDVITLTFGTQITDYDGDIDVSNIVVDIVDSAPIFQNGGPQPDNGLETVDESNAGPLVESGQLVADFGGDNPGHYEGVGSEVPTGILSNGQAVTVTFDSATQTFSGSAGTTLVFTLILDSQTGEYTYTQFQALDHPNSSHPDDVITMQFGVNAVDSEGDKAQGSIVINVRDDGPDAVNDSADVREGNTITGNILSNDDAGADGLDALVSVSYNGQVTALPATGSVSVTGQYGTLTLNANGNYSYTPHNNDPDGIDAFTYTIRDGDGDLDTAVLSIDVTPDMIPIDISGSGSTDDGNVAGSASDVEVGNINVNYQGDTHQATTGNGAFSANGQMSGGTLTHNGSAVNVTFNSGNNTYTGSVGGLTIFTMQINADATYRFVQYETLDHGNTGDNNEAINLHFGVTAMDTDGDTGNGTVRIAVRDDGPTARNDSNSLGQGVNSASGNVLGNDSAGADGGAIVTTPGTYNGNFGTLTINANGSYSYNRFSVWTGGTDNFNYTMRDSDGDTSSARLTISVAAIPQNTGGDGGGGSPLVVDLDRDGIEVTPTEKGVRFDMGSDGDMDLVAWVGADDGLLAIDANHDGIINDQSELFGTLEVDGFHVLAEHDLNHDGVINKDDAVYDELRIWQDVNQDGVTQEGELTTLAERGIASINLAATSTDYYMEGSWVAYNSTFTYDDGTTGQIADVWFKYIDEGIWNNIVDAMGEDAATEWLQNAYSTVTQFIPSDADVNWQEGDPLVLGSTHKVFEVGLNDSIVSQDGELTIFYGNDDPGEVSGNGNFQVGGSLLNGGFSSHGQAINVTYDAATGIYFGMTEDTMVFNLRVGSDGNYTFNLFESLDHGNDVNLDDNILMQFGVTVTDADGDSTDSSIRIQLRDAGSYLSGDVDNLGDNDDGFSSADYALFQAIGEASSTVADLDRGSDHSDLDISTFLEGEDEVSGSIQDYVHAHDGDNVFADATLGDATTPDLSGATTVPQNEWSDVLPDSNVII